MDPETPACAGLRPILWSAKIMRAGIDLASNFAFGSSADDLPGAALRIFSVNPVVYRFHWIKSVSRPILATATTLAATECRGAMWEAGT
jgi:hypothetical protein